MHRNVRALSRGLALISELSAGGPSNVVQLAKRTGLNRTTCYRLLDTLGEDGYVTFDETNALFGLTPQVRSLSEGVSSRDLSSQAALPAMFGLLDDVSWPSDFGVFELGSVLIRESTHPFSPFSVHRSMVGRRRSLVRSALGKAILAASSPSLRREMLDLTASLVEEDADLAKDRRFIDDILLQKEGRLCVVGRRLRSGHQRHRIGHSGRRPRSRQSQSDLLLVVDDTRRSRQEISRQHEGGREGNRAALVCGKQGAGEGRLNDYPDGVCQRRANRCP
jgi:IclR family mhp operon transcriptional activator